jgi:hypothetical protein
LYYLVVSWIPLVNQRIFKPINENQLGLENVQSTQIVLGTQIHQLGEIIEIRQSTVEMGLTQIAEDELLIQGTLDTNTWLLMEQTLDISTLDAKQNSTSRNLSALATAQMKYAGSQYQLDLLAVIDILSSASQDLLHNNYGLAELKLIEAQKKLEGLLLEAYGFQQQTIHELLDLIKQTINDLPENPNLAENKLLLAWEIAIQGFPDPFFTGSTTPTPYNAPTVSLTPTPVDE